MKTLVLSAIVLPLSVPAFAQESTIGAPQPTQGSIGVQTGAPTATAPVADPGQLDFGRSPASGVAAPGASAGTSPTSTGVPGTDDEYTRPIYGNGMR